MSGIALLTSITLITAIYFVGIWKINKEYAREYAVDSPVSLRKFPYPYRAAMTISSDIDDTGTLEEFQEIERFITTTEMTSMGRGVGLDIGNSFFFYEHPKDEDRVKTGRYTISYFSGGPDVARNIIQSIKSGHIDVLHSFGNKSDFRRDDAIRALEELKKTNCRIDVWVDHERSLSNFGDGTTTGLGAHLDSHAYHADLTLAYGIKFAWLGEGTMITGQSVPLTLESFSDIYDSAHPVRSFANIGKEITKNALAVFGNSRYAMHKNNDLVRIAKLDDGQRIYEFIRFDNYWRGLGKGGTSRSLAYTISERTLNRLKEAGGYMIVYTHFGMNKDCGQVICKDTQDALRNLAKECQTGNIFVATTSKLLNYYIIHKYLDWSYTKKEGKIFIFIKSVRDPIRGNFLPSVRDLEGITFYVPHNIGTRIYVDNKLLNNVRSNADDYSGKASVTILPVSY